MIHYMWEMPLHVRDERCLFYTNQRQTIHFIVNFHYKLTNYMRWPGDHLSTKEWQDNHLSGLRMFVQQIVCLHTFHILYVLCVNNESDLPVIFTD